MPVQSEKPSSQVPQQWEPSASAARWIAYLTILPEASGADHYSLPRPFVAAKVLSLECPPLMWPRQTKLMRSRPSCRAWEEKNVEAKLANGILSIKGEKQEETEEKDKNYRRERSFGHSSATFKYPTLSRPIRLRRVSKTELIGDPAQEGGSTEAGQNNRGEGGLVRRRADARLEDGLSNCWSRFHRLYASQPALPSARARKAEALLRELAAQAKRAVVAFNPLQ